MFEVDLDPMWVGLRAQCGVYYSGHARDVISFKNQRHLATVD
jgi:hypothetical protein